MKTTYKGSALLILYFFLLVSIQGFCQTSPYKANYMFEVPVGKQIASEAQFEQLKEMVINAYTSKNLFSHQSAFVIVPSIKIISEKNAGEAHVIKVVKVEIGLTTQGKDDDYVFHKFRQVYTITADHVESAISKGIASLAKEQKLKSFFDQSNQNIAAFYESNCATILNTVKVNIERQEYLKAFDYLRYVPETVTCYKESERIITKIFIDSKEENCRKLVQKAHASEAKQDYTKALYYLQFVDPTVTCYSSAADLVNKIESRIDEKTLRNFEMEKLTFSKLSDLKKMEIIAKEVDFISLTLNE